MLHESLMSNILFHKISVWIKCCIIPTSWQYKNWSPDPHSPLPTFDALTEWRLKNGLIVVNLRSVQCERSNQENEEDGSYGSKIEERVIQQDSRPKRGKPLKNRKTRKRCSTSSSSQSRYPPS